MSPHAEQGIADELIKAFIRLAQGDFSVRMSRNFTRDTTDTLAYFVNLIAEELNRLLTERDRNHRELEKNVAELSEKFLGLASGDYSVRATRTGRGDPIDVLAFLFNNTAAEVGAAFNEIDRQRHTLAAILESMLDGVIFLDASGTIQRTNAALAGLLGREPAQLIGQPLSVILAAKESELAGDCVSILERGALRDRTTEFLCKNGETLSMTVNASAFSDQSGSLAGVVLVARDDRQLKRVQAQLQMTDRLAAVGTVAAGVAHEINNPLAYVMSNLDFVTEELSEGAAEGVLSEEQRDEILRALRAAHRGAERVRQLVRDLKTFSRADRDSLRPLDINKLVDSSVGMIKNEIRHHAQLVKEYGDVPLVQANEGRLGQVFINLVHNAAQAIPPGRAEHNTIRIVTGTTAAGEALIEVHDTGSGIAPEHLHRIFDAFFTTKPVGVGTGLGLSICHQIVTSLGGRIEVSTKLGVGSTFRVILPAARAKESDTDPDGVPPTPVVTRRKRILVVDDEQEVAQSIRRILGREHEVDVVNRGAAAIEAMQRREYDVILCDLMMPEMTGMQLYAQVAATRPDLLSRMVFMTGGAFSPDARTFLDRVPNLRIEKPFDTQGLRTLVATMLDGEGRA